MVVLLRAMQHVWPVPRAQEPMPSHTIVPDPPRGWVLHRLPLVGGNRRSMVREGRTEAVLQGRLAEHTDRHDPHQCHAPLGRFAREGRGPTRRVCAAPPAPFRLLLACIAGQPGRR